MEVYRAEESYPDGKLIATNQLDEISLSMFYGLMHKAGLLPVVYHQAVPSLRSFLEWHEQPDSVWLGFILERDGEQYLAGMAWINSVQERGPAVVAAEVGHAFLPEFMGFLSEGIEIPREAIGMGLRYVFTQTPITILLGTTPTPNRAAVRFISKCGFEISQPVPEYTSWGGRPCAAILSWMTRAMWAKQNAEREYADGAPPLPVGA